jgi:hypothetical protein
MCLRQKPNLLQEVKVLQKKWIRTLPYLIKNLGPPDLIIIIKSVASRFSSNSINITIFRDQLRAEQEVLYALNKLRKKTSMKS